MLLITALVVLPQSVAAQSKVAQARGLVSKAMQAYSNLDLDTAKNSLEKALALASDIDKMTLANIYANFGVLWAGGFVDNAKAKQSFMIALCLDSTVQVDPMVSTPEIHMLFKLAQKQTRKKRTCKKTLANIEVPDDSGGADPTIGTGGGDPDGDPGDIYIPDADQLPSCGEHLASDEQKRQYEFPVYVETHNALMGQLDRMIAFYALDDSLVFSELVLSPTGLGYASMITCEDGIKEQNPRSIAYYIEGQDSSGRVICGHGTSEAPLRVMMMSEAVPPSQVAGLIPRNCSPDADMPDELPQYGEICRPDMGCADGLVCGDFGTCEKVKKKEEPERPTVDGPSKFYATIGGGSGFGYISKEMNIRQFTQTSSDEREGFLEEVKKNPSGTAWNGVPVRLEVGFFVAKHFSIEIGGRFDAKIDTFKEYKSCWELSQERAADPTDLTSECLGPIDDDPSADEIEAAAKRSVAHEEGKESSFLFNSEYRVAWLAHVRARYWFMQLGRASMSAFLGAGYGYTKYRISGVSGQRTLYFPMTGMIDIEVGAAVVFNITKNVGFLVELPIDVMVGDGFGLNVDLNIGLSFGY